MTEHDWLKEGARVAVCRAGGWAATVTFATVERLTARDAILDNGKRYNRARLHETGRSTYEGSTLRDPADPWVVTKLQEQKRRNRDNKVRVLIDDADKAVREGKYDNARLSLRDALDKLGMKP